MGDMPMKLTNCQISRRLPNASLKRRGKPRGVLQKRRLSTAIEPGDQGIHRPRRDTATEEVLVSGKDVDL